MSFQAYLDSVEAKTSRGTHVATTAGQPSSPMARVK